MLAFGLADGRGHWSGLWSVGGEGWGWGRREKMESGKEAGRTDWQRAAQSDGGTRAMGQVGQPWCPGIEGVWVAETGWAAEEQWDAMRGRDGTG